MTTKFEGNYFLPGRSASEPVTVEVDDKGVARVSSSGTGAALGTFKWSKIKVSARVGNIPRRLTLPNGSIIETGANDVIDGLNKTYRMLPSISHFLHQTERLTLYTLFTVLILSGVAYWVVVSGLPSAADSVARRLPPSLLNQASEESLELMDKVFFEPSKLDPSRKKELEELFARVVQASGSRDDFNLLFRRGTDRIGANALALPDGTIVITDELVDLSDDDRGLMGVFAHEVGHVVERHSMRSLLQSTTLGLIIVFITGDLSQVSELALGLPVIFVQAGYSRDFETEADAYATELMEELKVDPKYLGDILLAMQEACEEKTKGDCSSGWFSTHPDTGERAQALK